MDFLRQKKVQIIFLLIAIIIGLSLGICVGLNNAHTFTFINISDKSVIAIFSGGNFFDCFINTILHWAFLFFLILVINNFSFLTFLNYLLFAYLAFKFAVNVSIIFCTLGLKSVLYLLLCYIPFSLLFFLCLIFLFLICNNTINCGTGKFKSYPYKIFLILFCAILIFSILYVVLSRFFSKFIVIII